MAESNEKIIGHLIIINSPGGESYNLENVNKQIRSLNKPVISAVKKTMCSAGLYLGVAADKVYCINQFDLIGSIGTMISYWDCKKALEQYGYTLIEAYATKSTHKNKITKDVEEGKTEEFIKRFLDPVQDEFEKIVRQCRSNTANAPDEAHVFNGEIYYAEEAIKYGLIDGVKSLDEIIIELYQLGKEYQTRSKISIT
jgi:protease-4